jgi:hypothetical protein
MDVCMYACMYVCIEYMYIYNVSGQSCITCVRRDTKDHSK